MIGFPLGQGQFELVADLGAAEDHYFLPPPNRRRNNTPSQLHREERRRNECSAAKAELDAVSKLPGCALDICIWFVNCWKVKLQNHLIIDQNKC